MDEDLTSDGGEDKYFTAEVDSPSECKRTLRLEVNDGAFQNEKTKLVEKLRRDLEVPGFRKGKVPISYIKKNYGDAIHADAVQNLLTQAYQEAIEDKDLRPLADPRFEDMKAEDGVGVSVTAHLEVKPDIEVSGYLDVSVEVKKEEVGDDQVDRTLESVRQSMATYMVVERPAQGEDLLVVDFTPYLETGEPDEKAAQKNQAVSLDSDGLLPEFRQGLTGMSPGEEKEILVRYPDDFTDKNLAGKTGSFWVKVSEVKEKLLPELDDAFAQKVSEEVKTLEALKNRIRVDLEKEEDNRHQFQVQETIIDELIEKNTIEVPDAMVENYLTSIVEEDRKRNPSAQAEVGREQQVRDVYREPAARAVKKYLIMEAVVRQEDLAVTDEEFEEKMKSLSESVGRPIEDVRNMFRDPKHRRNLENELLDQKVLNFLREKADIKVA